MSGCQDEVEVVVDVGRQVNLVEQTDKASTLLAPALQAIKREK